MHVAKCQSTNQQLNDTKSQSSIKPSQVLAHTKSTNTRASLKAISPMVVLRITSRYCAKVAQDWSQLSLKSCRGYHKSNLKVRTSFCLTLYSFCRNRTRNLRQEKSSIVRTSFETKKRSLTLVEKRRKVQTIISSEWERTSSRWLLRAKQMEQTDFQP